VLYTLFAILGIWLFTVAWFVATPVLMVLRRDVRAAREAGIANAGAVARRRFFVPRRSGPLHAALLNRVAWVERYSYPVHERHALRVIAVRTGAVTFEDGSVFEPRRTSKRFADGAGTAKGVLREEHQHHAVPALVVFT
jgi:hypothetical protein